MKIFIFLLFLTLSLVSYSDERCSEIKLSKSLRFEVEVEVSGERGTLRFPAIIDTGATFSIIPDSIASGVGYQSSNKGEFKTASGNDVFKIINIKRLKFENAEFTNVDVAVENRKQAQHFYPPYPAARDNPNCTCSNSNSVCDCTKSDDESELAAIGMSQLSKTKFSFSDGVLKICQ